MVATGERARVISPGALPADWCRRPDRQPDWRRARRARLRSLGGGCAAFVADRLAGTAFS